MTKHTPGPWTLGNGEVRIRTEKNELGRSTLIAECYTTNNAGRYPKLEERKANARLIAAAPELLEAIKRFLNAKRHEHLEVRLNTDELEAVEMMRKAIAKVEGES